MNLESPRQASFSPFADLDNEMQRCVDEGEIAGMVVLVIHHGETVHHACLGKSSVEKNSPMHLDAIFRIASMTKPITATAIMMLQERGLIKLDDPVSDYIPAFRDTPVYARETVSGHETTEQKHPLTIRHLLTHTSGMGLGAGKESYLDSLYYAAVEKLRNTPGTTNQSAVQELANLPLAFQPGTGWRYGLSFEVLAALVEIASGEWFDVFLRKQIFKPLRMKDTGHIVPHDNAARLTALYSTADGQGLQLIEDPSNSPHILPLDFEYMPGTAWLPGGGMMVSTASDYARFVQMLVNGGTLDDTCLLQPETVERMTANHLSPDLLPFDAKHPEYGHGLGVRVRMDSAQAGQSSSVGEFTGDGGHGTYFWANPGMDLAGILMLQMHPIPYPVHERFRTLTYQAIEMAGKTTTKSM